MSNFAKSVPPILQNTLINCRLSRSSQFFVHFFPKEFSFFYENKEDLLDVDLDEEAPGVFPLFVRELKPGYGFAAADMLFLAPLVP